MSDESNTLTISKDKYKYACWALCILLIVILILIYKLSTSSPTVTVEPSDNGSVIEDGKKVPLSKPAKDFFKAEGYDKLILIKNTSEVKIVDAVNGKDISACALNVGQGFIDIPKRKCDFKDINLENATAITIVSISSSPKRSCPIIWGIPRC